MPGLDLTLKLSMIALVGGLIGLIVLYHIWLDGLLARERNARPTPAPPPEELTAQRLP